MAYETYATIEQEQELFQEEQEPAAKSIKAVEGDTPAATNEAQGNDSPKDGDTPNASNTPEDKPFDKDKWAADKKAERENVYATIDKTTERLTEDPTAFLGYLDVMAQFPRHSVANTLLVFAQAPEATRIADFDTWKERGASVRKGEGAIAILEPGDDYTREDGSIGKSFNVKKVFDASQTSAKPAPTRRPDMGKLIFAITDSSPVAIKTAADLPPAEFARYDHESKIISIKPGLDAQSNFKALSVELAHVVLAGDEQTYDREANRETALFAAYVVARRNDVPVNGMMPVFTPQSATGSLQEIRGELGRIRGTAKEVGDGIDRVLDVLKEQDKAVKPKVQGRGGRDGR